MAKDIDIRIARRNAVAEENLHRQGLWAGFKNRIGLAAANTLDRADNAVNGDTTTFVAGTAYGAVRGAIFATLGYLGIAALGLVTSGMALPLLAGMVAVGSVGMGIYQGQKDLDNKRERQGSAHLSDRIAVASGAIPARSTAHSMASLEPEQEGQGGGHVDRLNARGRGAQRSR